MNGRPLSYIVIANDALLHNLRLYQKATKLPVAPVLKSNAYGHGIELVAQVLDRNDVPFFIVNAVEEAFRIRASGVRKEILVIGYTAPETIISTAAPDIVYTITSVEQLRAMVRKARRDIQVHIKVDTGMHRQGIAPTSVAAVIRLVQRNRHIKVVGLCSHFADADGTTETLMNTQIATWEGIVSECRGALTSLRWIHISATAGSYYAQRCTANLARLGIGLYGFDCSKAQIPTRPVLSLYSTLTNIKQVERGARIGYNGTFRAPQAMTIGTIPLGYYEGVDRRLSNKGWVAVRGVLCPIVGRVSMNITTIDISALKNPKEGEQVQVISTEREARHSVEQIAALCSTITYEICVHLQALIPRLSKKRSRSVRS